jgi:hypothetical protein
MHLPDDVLIEILVFCVLDVEISPYLLGQVCKTFHSILVQIPKVILRHLWRKPVTELDVDLE